MVLVLALVVAALWQLGSRTTRPHVDSSYFGYGGTPRRGNALTYKPGARFRIRFDVTNWGNEAITVTGIRWPTLEDDLVSFESARMYAREGTNIGRLVPVGPVMLQPDETRFFVVRMRFDRCPHTRPTDILGLGDPLLEFRHLGEQGSMGVRLTGRVRLLIPATCGTVG
jgi:hypothetical protein